VDMIARFAALPYRKPLDTFDYDFQRTVGHRLVRDLASLRLLEHGENVVMMGTDDTHACVTPPFTSSARVDDAGLPGTTPTGAGWRNKSFSPHCAQLALCSR
jgi:hypothetical protein